MNRLKILNTILVFGVTISLIAQPANRPTQKDVDNQKIYIEANKEKLLGNNDAAIVLFAEVLRKDKSNSAAAFELAKLYKKTGRNEKALDLAKQARELKKDNIWYSQYYAELLKENQSYEEAANVYEEVVKQNSRQKELYFEWAYLLIKAEKSSQAIKVYDDLEAKVGVNERTSRRKYMLYLSEGKKSKAEAELKKLINEFPKETRFYHYLAEFYDKQNNKEQVNATYKKILEINPADPIASIAMSSSLKDEGEEINYLASLATLFENPKVNIDLKVKELLPYIRKINKIDEATKNKVLGLANQLTKVHSEDARAFSIYADLLYYSGDTKSALTQYINTSKLDSDVFAVWEQIMYIYADLKEVDNLLETSEEVIDLFPNQATAYYMNGVANSLKKNYTDAVDMFEQSLMMSGKDKNLKYKVLTELGTTYHHLTNYEKSDENFEAALVLNPKDYYTLNNYSYYLSVRGEKLEKAKKLSAQANSLSPDKPLFQDTYGWVFYKLEDYQNAKKWIKKALDNGGTNSAIILEHYGDVMYQLDNVDDAVKYWQMAREKGAKSERLSKKIADRKLYE